MVSVSGLAGLTPEEVSQLPKKTLAELAAPALPGERHNQLKRLVIPMIGEGFAPDRVFQILREIYESDVADREIADLIRWALAQPFEPCLRANGRRTYPHPSGRVPFTGPKKISLETKVANTERFLKGFRCSIDDLKRASPARAQKGVPWLEAELYFVFLFPDDYPIAGGKAHINVVTEFVLDPKGRAMPVGAGETRTRVWWLEYIRQKGVPQGEAGAWVRPNPVLPRGSGKAGSYTDSDVTQTRYCLLESDCLPIELQASLFAKLPVPIAAIIDSGGKSLHAIVKLFGDDQTDGRQLLEQLSIFGVDQANCNASRLSRLPGALRKIGAREKNGCCQHLIYLDNAPIWPLDPSKRWKGSIL